MRDIKTLLRAGTASDKVSDYRWRSAEEIVFYAQSLCGGPQIATASKLERASLNRVYAECVEIQNRLDTLVGLDVCASYNFKKHQVRIKTHIAAARADLERRRNVALAGIQRAARKQEPAELRTLAASVHASTIARFKGNYDRVTEYVYAAAPGTAGLEFNHYIQFDRLYNAEVGFVYPEYYVVLTARVAEATTLHATVLHEFRAPGRFSAGDATTASHLPALVKSLLQADAFD